jgi:hypothetical protein
LLKIKKTRVFCTDFLFFIKILAILWVLYKNYLTPILVAFAFPDKISFTECFAEAIITFVPILTASLTYSSLAFAPFAPTLEAPLQ